MTDSLYPTQEDIDAIIKWDFDVVGIKHFLDFIRSVWWMPDWGFIMSGKRILKLQLHTGGWSGNEDIIGAMRQNFIFWGMCWTETYRGGHHYFRIDTKLFK
jgi:hypothetical protein